jgi:hypothetical protein
LYAYSNPTVYIDLDGYKSIFGDATQQLENFKDWLAEKNKAADSHLAAFGIGTAQFVATLGEGMTRPLNVAANLAQVAAGVDDQQVRDELAGTKASINKVANYVVNGDYAQTAKNIHQAAVNETVKAMEGDVTATANVTQAVWAAATLRDTAKGKAKNTDARLTAEAPDGLSTQTVTQATQRSSSRLAQTNSSPADVQGARVMAEPTPVRGSVVESNVANNTVARNPNVYEALFESPISGTSRTAHRASANEFLANQLSSDAQFAGMLNKELGTDVLGHMQTGRNLLNPPGTVWHHPFDNPSVMQLLRSTEHTAPSLQPVLHPNGIGGYGTFYGP